MEDRLRFLLQRVGVARQDAQLLMSKMLENPELALTPAQAGKLIPTRTGNRRDRELVRKQIFIPLEELGFFEKVTAKPGRTVLLGHPIPKSPFCAYRLTRHLVDHVRDGMPWELGETAKKVVDSLNIFEASSTHEQLMDSCVVHFADWHLPGFQLLYRDPAQGPKVRLEDLVKLSAAGLRIDILSDPCPDLVFWDEKNDTLCIVEAVTTEGIVDDRRKRNLHHWVHRHRPGMPIKCVTAFHSWKRATPFMKDMAKDSYVWIQESPFRLWHCS